MAEKPLSKLARLVGGVAMLPGPLGHQVFGQLLISKSTGTELAGANVVLAAVSRQTNAAVQIAVRSMVPAVLVETLSRIEQQRLERLASELERLLKAIKHRSAEVYGKPEWRILKDPQKQEPSQSLDEEMFRKLLKLRCSDGRSDRRAKVLQYILGTHDPKPMGSGDGRQRATDEPSPESNPETPPGITPFDAGRSKGE